MSGELLRRAAAGIRQDFADPSAWSGDAERPFYIAVADWLDETAERHSEGPPTELVLHYDDGPCEVCDGGGHEVPICEGCFPTWEGMDGYCVYPCRETKAALAVASAFLGVPADD